MSWIVRIVVDDPDSGNNITAQITTAQIITAAVMADSTGTAEVHDPELSGRTTLLVGFDDRRDADAFAANHPGSEVVPVDTTAWATPDIAEIDHLGGVIQLEVGTAFGHGAHPTTALALDALAALGDGADRTLLDVGCGTGVLTIAAARQGFVVSGCDNDPDAVAIATRNAERNHVTETASFVCATPTQLATPAWLMRSTGFDVVVVNTLIGVHEAEGAAISALAAEHGPIIIAGIQGPDQLERAVAAYPPRQPARRQDRDGWTLAELRTV